ncbi:MAG: HlyD family efflux transporter periplasmic adaptor subunit [Gammaproteobacteria bacterium]|nr:HlyD family efflux transporter periplasmic adaptor subunit [Gammaproteobacteria bacterium]
MIRRYTIMARLILIISLITVSGCGNHQQAKQQVDTTAYTVKAQSWQQTLYFSGTLRPLEIKPIVAPVDGAIANIGTHPGQSIKEGALLYTITTQLAEKTFQPAFTSYLKDKKALADADQKQQNSKLLYDNEILSRNEYQQSLEGYYTAQLTAIQSKQTLEQALSSLKLEQNNKALFILITHLDLSRVDDIKRVLSEVTEIDQFSIYSPVDGLLLLPTTDSGSSNSKSTAKGIGSNVKQGELLGKIGTTNGIAVDIQIDEANITKLHPGQSAIVSTLILPGQRLKGILSRINVEAESSHGSPQFMGTVTIAKLSKQIKQQLRFGVNAKVEIQAEGKKAIFIPIDAITENNGNTTVEKVDANGKTTTTAVTIGTTLEKRVMIISGLSEGDKILVPTD